MISFIICDNNAYMRKVYKDIINKFFTFRDDQYKIFEFDYHTKDIVNQISHIGGVKIYLINADEKNHKSFNLAREIRSSSLDFISPMILLTNQDKTVLVNDLSNILFVDIVVQNDNLCCTLFKAIKDAYKITTRRSTYTFTSFDEVNRLPYDDIFYISKNTNEDSVTIYTNDDSYMDYKSLKNVEKILYKDPRFFKSHRSCIINLFNVSNYDKKSNTVIFKNGMSTDKVSRCNKTILEKKLNNNLVEVK